MEVVPSFPQNCPLISLRIVSTAEVGLAPYVQIFPYSPLLVLCPAMPAITISVIITVFLKNKSYYSPKPSQALVLVVTVWIDGIGKDASKKIESLFFFSFMMTWLTV